MSLPDAKTILKRAREEARPETDFVSIAYKAVCAYLNDRSPVELVSGVLINTDVVPALKNVSWSKKANVFRLIAKTPGYVVCVTLKEEEDANIPVPVCVWDWEYFYECVYDGFDRVMVRVE